MGGGGGPIDPRLGHVLGGDPRRARIIGMEKEQEEQARIAEEQQKKAKEYSEGSIKKFPFKPENCLMICIPLSQQMFFSYDSRDPEAIEGFLCPGPSNMGLHFPRAFEIVKTDAQEEKCQFVEYFLHNGTKIMIHTMLDVIGTGVVWQIVKKPEWWPKPGK